MTNETKKNLLSGARQLLLAEGIGSLTVEKICAEVGVSKGGFFHHFANKGELLVALLNELTERQKPIFNNFLEQDQLEFGRSLRTYIKTVLSSSGSNAEDAKAICRCMIEIMLFKPDLLKLSCLGGGGGYEAFVSSIVTTDGMSRAQATLILLATEGLWYDQSLEIYSVAKEKREVISAWLVELTTQAVDIKNLTHILI